MTLADAMAVMEGQDRIRIMKGKAEIYAGFLGCFQYMPGHEEYEKEEVARITETIDIKHKRYEELGLMPPLHTEQTPDYKFSDLQLTLYRKIILKNEV